METQWNIRSYSAEEESLIAQLAAELNISSLAARMLVVRGIRTADAARTYIRPNMNQLHDPFLMRDMEKAVERLRRAIADNERILVYGDYDVDGTTAVALMYTFLSKLTQNLDYYIPDRYTEGYGISFQGIDYAEQTGCTLIVALDCGIKAVDKVQYARAKNIDFIVCDHHTPGDTIPEAVAVLNMKRSDCTYPYKELSGCGVGFTLARAYCQATGWDPEQNLYPLLPLLAMSIASDVVPVTGENRILAFYGLKRMNASPSVGQKAIMDVAGIANRTVNMTDLVFKFGPRINACGRLYSGREAVKLLITDDPEFANEQAKSIDSFNQERRDFDNRVTEEALEMLKEDTSEYTTVVYSPEWHKGVVGIAASRLTETYYRPTIVLTAGEDGIISGSARSVSDFDIYAAIDSCHDLLTNFGGHKFAAGLSMRKTDLPEFKRRFEQYVREHVRPEQRVPVVDAEAEVSLSEITPQLYNVMRCLEPFGPENPRPVFVTRNCRNCRFTKRVGQDGKHLKLDLTDGTAAMSGIAFGLGDYALHLQQGGAVDVCYEVEPNTFNGQTTLQMMVSDVKEVRGKK